MVSDTGVSVKLGGALVEFAPGVADESEFTKASQTNNQYVLELKADTSVQDVLDKLAIPAEQPLMIILNDAMVARPDYQTTLLTSGDALALMPPIKAG